MDDSVKAALAKWPNVPHCYGWLALDRRGRWLLKGDPLQMPNLEAFIARNYDGDDHGRWFFQNGPQRVYVELAYAPWTLRLTAAGTLESHTGEPADRIERAWLDDDGNLLLQWRRGLALLDDRDLPTLVDAIRNRDGTPADHDRLHAFIDGRPADFFLHWRSQVLPLGFIRGHAVPQRFAFVRIPRPET